MSLDPYSQEGWLREFKFRAGMSLAITDPRAQAVVTGVVAVSRSLVVDDPFERWAGSWRAFWRQLRDIVLHEFWVGAGRPHKAPGARWV